MSSFRDHEDMRWDVWRRSVLGPAQRLGRTRLGVLAIGRVVSPLQRWLYVKSAGRISLTGRAPVLLLTTTGRRTGLERTVPLLYTRDADRLVVCNVNPGFERPNPWILNLRADHHARVQLRQEVFDVTAREASGAEMERYWPRLTQIWPAYQAFYDKGGKRSVFHPPARLMPARGKHAELVALGIGEDDPGHIALTEIDARRPQAEQSLDLRVAVAGPKVRVEPILHRFRRGHVHE